MVTKEKKALRGQTLTFKGDPFAVGPDESISFEADGAVVIQDGIIIDVGPASAVLARHPQLRPEHYPDCLIMAGFIDAHVHYPQTEIIAAYGEQLLEWLNSYTFPAESRFGDKQYADHAASFFLDEALRNGVTSSSVYCTSHPQSVTSLFEQASKRGMRMAAGKVMMDRNAPDHLLDTPETSFEQSQALIEQWHGKNRCVYAITPRFAPTSSPEQLEAAGALWEKYPSTLMQTHISESESEIAWVKELFPEARDYLDVYERYGLLKSGANFGHGIHLTDREIAALRESGAGLSHCPTSNTFIGSGLFKMADLREGPNPITVGLATDIGGGSSFSIFDTMKSAYEIGQLQGYSLHPAKAYYLATLGSAKLMQLDDKIGNLACGFEADIQVIDLKSRPVIAQRMAHAGDIWDVLFLHMILADDRAIRCVYIGGAKVYDRDASS
ncbi:MAG: guanine deaminase [Rhodospirillales bacterium]|nr:guanine deaminase [Rhodospirillales bacterium]